MRKSAAWHTFNAPAIVWMTQQCGNKPHTSNNAVIKGQLLFQNQPECAPHTSNYTTISKAIAASMRTYKLMQSHHFITLPKIEEEDEQARRLPKKRSRYDICFGRHNWNLLANVWTKSVVHSDTQQGQKKKTKQEVAATTNYSAKNMLMTEYLIDL